MVAFLGSDIEWVVLFALFGEAAVLAALLVGYVLARRHMGKRHHSLMLGAFVVDEAVFKPLMTFRALDVWGGFPWPGTAVVAHLVANSAAVTLAVAAIALGFRHRIERDGRMLMPPQGRLHRWLGRAFLAAWTVTFVIGVSIFVEAYY